MKPRDYCCCAIPIVNAGVYATLLEQLVAGAVIGVLALATPDIVGAATPSFASWVFGIVCIALAAVQVLGFIAVAREKSILFRRFLSLHLMLLLAAFSLGAAWTVWSAVRHSEAKTDCINDFYDKSDSMQADQADKLCEIFPWVDIGIMGGLLALFGIMHIYLYFVLSSYSSGQVRDHAKYDAINESATAFNDGIPMRTRGQTWDTPVNNTDQTVYGHRRQDSSISMSDVMAQPVHKQVDDYSDYRSAYPPQPAHLMEDNTTPKYSENFYGGPSPHGERPPNAQVHPAEGSFRRKTPRAHPWGYS